MDVENMFTYGLLLYFGLEEKMKLSIELLEKYGTPKQKIFLVSYLEYYSENGWPDIYEYLEKPEVIVPHVKSFIEILENSIEYDTGKFYKLINNWFTHTLDNDNFNEILKILKDNYISKVLFDVIYDSYLDLINSNNELEFCSTDFYNALIRKKDTGSMSMRSRHGINELKKHFADRVERELGFNKFVFDKLPLKIFNDIPKLTEKRISQYFKRELANKLIPVLMDLTISINTRNSIIGLCFSIQGLCLDFETYLDEEFNTSIDDLENDDFYILEYKEFLRQQAKDL